MLHLVHSNCTCRSEPWMRLWLTTPAAAAAAADDDDDDDWSWSRRRDETSMMLLDEMRGQRACDDIRRVL